MPPIPHRWSTTQQRDQWSDPPHLNKDRVDKLRKRYGVTPVKFVEMYVVQNGGCGICGRPETIRQYGEDPVLSVDHNGETGQVRGLLCRQCNAKLHVLEDDQWVRRANEYLERADATYPQKCVG